MSDPFKKVSPAALIALKEALAVIYWYKKDIRSFISYTIKNNAIVSTMRADSITDGFEAKINDGFALKITDTLRAV